MWGLREKFTQQNYFFDKFGFNASKFIEKEGSGYKDTTFC